jgi:pimeloyl-ACP methyl ester carboxylesterase
VEFERTTVTVSGTHPVRLSVIDQWPREPQPDYGTIVMLHGAGGDAEQWSNQIDYFGRRYRVIAPDLRGHGQSEKPHSSYALEEFLWDFGQLLTQLKVREPFVLMAHSFGGPVAMTFAAAYPERVGRLVLVATAPEMHLGRWVEFILKLPLPLSTLERMRPLLAPRLHAPLFVLQRVLAGTLFPWRGWELLPQITTPTLVIGGQFDFIVPQAVLERMQAAMPGARFELVRYARHLPQLERPAALNRAVEGFIERRRNWRGEELEQTES